MLTLERWVSKQRELLALEQEEETTQNQTLVCGSSGKELEKEGLCLTKLYPAGINTGLYGRRVLTLTRDPLPSHSLHSGDIVGLAHKDLTVIAQGIVSKVGKDCIGVAFEELEGDILQLNKVSLIKLTNTVTYKRYLSAVKQVEKGEHELVEKLISDHIRLAPPPVLDLQLEYQNENLNTGQRSAVEMCLTRSDVSIVHGPPGTGKSTTIVEVVRQHVMRGDKVLVCAPSNIAVDNLLLKLSTSCKVVRLGHPARVNSDLQYLSLDAQLKGLDEYAILGDVRKDIDSVLTKRGKPGGNLRGIGDLKKELRERQLKMTKEVLMKAQVVLATLTGAGREGPLGKLPENHFAVCVIDEASQALEVACWMGLLNSRKVILAGDHHQLPPTIKSDEAAKGGLALTLMERILLQGGCCQEACATLTEQYRMNENIMRWSSEAMYGGHLTAHPSVATHLLSGISECTEVTASPLCYIDTAGAGCGETLVGVSRGNPGEASIVVQYLRELQEAGVREPDMAVITPYNLQIELIRAEMGVSFKGVEVCTVDGFQGREKEAIVISMVRSNPDRQIGFLSEARRMNVAVTRARRHVCLVGDSLTVKRDTFLAQLVQYFSDNGLVRSAFEYGCSECEAPVVQELDLSDDEATIEPCLPEPLEKQSLPSEPLFKDSSKAKLSAFNKSAVEKFILFQGLNSYQRRTIHLLSEELSLFSMSSGSGSQRELKVYKEKPTEEVVVDAKEDEKVGCVMSHVEGKPEEVPKPPPVEVCKNCGKRIPQSNLELHLLRCKPKVFKPPNQQAKSKAAPPKKGGKKKPLKNGEISEVNEDELLTRAAEDRLNCSKEGCPGRSSSYMPACRFCSRCFCVDHQFAEGHGCGARARAESRPGPSSARQHVANKGRIKQVLKEKEQGRSRKKNN